MISEVAVHDIQLKASDSADRRLYWNGTKATLGVTLTVEAIKGRWEIANDGRGTMIEEGEKLSLTFSVDANATIVAASKDRGGHGGERLSVIVFA